MTQAPSPEDGLFHDDDLLRLIGREGFLIAAGGAASLLQTAHPKIAQGVYDHSYTAEDPLGRLRGTMQWVYVVGFGSRAEAERLSGVVRKMHDRVTGPGYAAGEPELQVWVAATLFATAVQVYELIFRTLSEEELAAYYEQSKIYATILGCPYAMMPATYDDFRVYYADMIATLRISDASRAIADQVLHPRLPGGPLNEPGLAAIRLVTAGLMPAPIREQYGWRWDRARQARFRVLMAGVRLVYPRLPLRVRAFPRDHYLRDLRKRLPKVPANA
ncbi:oxygenase MpaB family protein [Actinomadura sp. DC4]|uniref:oxygenase MpaB family protein n=1 Tax=Actinomadura sp. DC4 TaxID=3055069 RepID=UPI0025B27440|nr:oxygenase MpaB family protein [Actinomadura sp. DC4]MDN3359195.1 oxygenase MpaB family protein [Actinomadura sp. DC4]